MTKLGPAKILIVDDEAQNVKLLGTLLRAEGARFRVLPLAELPWPTKLGRSVTSLAAVAPAA